MKRLFTTLFFTFVLTYGYGQHHYQISGRHNLTKQVADTQITKANPMLKVTANPINIKQNKLSAVSNKEKELPSQNTMTQIKMNTKETADNTKKGGYEILTIVISSLAFLTAFVTLLITRLTYKSQEQTRRNTTPIFTKDRQYEVLISIAETLIDQIFHAYVIKYNFIRNNVSSIPSGIVFDPIYIDSSELHLELFYDEKGNIWDKTSKASGMTGLSNYSILSNLKQNIDSFNKRYDILTKQILDKSLDIETIKFEYYRYIIRGLLNLLGSVADVTDRIFNKKVDVLTHIIQYVYYEMIMNTCHVLSESATDEIITISFDEKNLEKVKKEMFKKMPGIKKLFDGEKDVWESFFFNRYSPFNFEFSNLNRINMSHEVFMGFVMICVYINYINDFSDYFPSINYEKER